MEKYLLKNYDIDINEFRHFSEGIEYQILKCIQCKSLYQTYEPKLSLLIKIYDEYINSVSSLNRKKFPSEDTMWLYSGEMSLISTLINNKSSQLKVLDYACGWGLWAKVARGWGYDVTVLELSSSRSEYLKNSGIRVINSLDNKSEAYDFVNCDQVFEHLCTPIDNLVEINRCLKMGGVVKISIPHTFTVGSTINRLKAFKSGAGTPPDIVAPLEHLNYCNRKGLSILAKVAGFEVIDVSLFSYIIHSKLISPDFVMTIKNILRPFYRRFFANIVFLRKIDGF